MGRKKIIIKPILDPKLRNITYNKRKLALLKKAAELSVLCSSKVFLAFTDTCDNLIIYVNPDVEFLKEEIYLTRNKKIYNFTEKDYPKFIPLGRSKKAPMASEQTEKGVKSVEKNFKIHEKKLLKNELFQSISNFSSTEHSPKRKNSFEKQNESKNSSKGPGQSISTPSPSKSKAKKLSIQIPKNKDLEYQMNMIKLMESLSKKNAGKEEISSLFVRRTSCNKVFQKNHPLFIPEIHPRNNPLSIPDIMKLKTESKPLSLDSAHSKHQLSDFLPNFSCEKKMEKHVFFDYEKNDVNCKRKFFDFIDETKHNSTPIANNINTNIPFFSTNHSQDSFHKVNDFFLNKKQKNFGNENFPINTIENIRISKESYINEIAKKRFFNFHSHEEGVLEEPRNDLPNYLK